MNHDHAYNDFGEFYESFYQVMGLKHCLGTPQTCTWCEK